MYRCGVTVTRFTSQTRCIYPVIKDHSKTKAFQALRCLSSSRDITTDAGFASRGRSTDGHSGKHGAWIGAAAAVGVSLYTLWKNGCANMEAAGDAQTAEKKSGSTTKPSELQQRGPAPPYPDLDTQPDIPGHAQYLIIGGGTAANAASKAIRARDPKSKVLIVTEEEFLPYMRPPLSKELWFHDEEDVHLAQKFKFKSWSGKTRSIFHQGRGFYVSPKELPYLDNGGIAVATGRKVVKLDPYHEKVVLDNGWEVHYDKCLLATGGQPRNLPVIQRAGEEVAKRTTLFRKAADYKQLYSDIENVKSVAVIGGGFLGSELAVALANKGKKRQMKVSQVFPEAGVLGVVLPEYLSKWTTERVKEEGVEVIPGDFVTGASFEDDQVQLTLNNGEKLSVDHIVVAVGIEPNVDLGKLSGLEVDDVHGGYRVNAELQARTNIWVAGDVCSFYDIKLGRRRVEHHDHAVVSGRLVGENMTGAAKPYWHQSMFWSDLGPQVGFEAIGLVDSRLPTVAVFAQASAEDTPQARDVAADKDSSSEDKPEEAKSEPEPTNEESQQAAESANQNSAAPAEPEASSQAAEDYGKGVVFYMKDDIIVGVVTWNVFGHMSVARKLLGQEHKDLAEVAKLFGLFKSEENAETENAESSSAETTPKETDQKTS